MTQADSVHSTPPTNTSANQTRSSRRGFLVQAAGVAAGGAALGMALPLPVSAGDSQRVPDPILAAIERHRRAYQDWMDNMGEDEIEDAVPSECRQSSLVGALYGDPDWQVAGEDPRWLAHIETACRTTTAREDAAIALVSFDTLSLAGVVALLEYVASVEAKDPESWPDLADDDGSIRNWHFFLVERLAEALPGMVGVV
jgi:hypothetical protein